MTRVSKSGIVVAATMAITACHLADDEDPPKCAPGTHPERGLCMQNETEEIRVVLTPATPCPTISPSSIKVKAGENFQFENKDQTSHTIKGTVDGQVWVTIAPNALSLGMSIARAGTWQYEVSGCGSYGTVVVE